MSDMRFLPVCREDMRERGIEQLDFVYVTGDAYVDHPSFGTAIIARVLESHGYHVGIIAQPDWKNENSVAILGKPRLGFLVSSGNMDSMVNHYYVSGKKREIDAYTPGGVIGKRPDRAVIVYSNLIRKVYKKIPIIIGGIEASLRRLAHYDYWSNRLKRSVLLDSSADLISYGMGEHSIVEIADALNSGIDINDITFIRGTVYKTQNQDFVHSGDGTVLLPDFESMQSNSSLYAKSFMIQYSNTDSLSGRVLAEPYRDKSHFCYCVQNPPAVPLSTEEMDDVYSLPFTGECHPMYQSIGKISAIDEVRFSLVSNRGCFGGCNFCALTFHQGRRVQVRSHESILEEARKMTEHPDFKGYIHDVGGPTANFRMSSCEKQNRSGVCTGKQCLFPKPCANLKVSHEDYLALLRSLRALPKVKKVFIRSGIRYDYLLADQNRDFLRELCEHHISGQLKVAPEHSSDAVLTMMGKPPVKVFDEFREAYQNMNKTLKKDQYLVPYFMSSHPGSTLKDAVKLAEYVRDFHYMPEQVQDFYPTPSTMSTVMYFTGLDPRTMKEVYVTKNPHEKAMQRALIQYRNPANYQLVAEALRLTGRTDLIGFGKDCLIRPRQLAKEKKEAERTKNAGKLKNSNNTHPKQLNARETTHKRSKKTGRK